MRWKVFDIESSNSPINIEKKYTRVWLWDLYNPRTKMHLTGTELEDFFYVIFSQPSQIIYTHNLKFDGSFIICYLLKHGFIISDSKEDYTINTLITDRLVWYTFTVYFNRKKYVFRDSAKKIIGSLRDAAINFNLPILKGEIQYDLHRDKGYIPTDEEIAYIRNDTEIVAKILEYYYDNGMTGITNASDAMKAYKELISRTGYSEYFPVLPKNVDDFIRKSYKGGYCYLNEQHFNKLIDNVYVYDVNSMYPYVMANKMLPYGVPEHYHGKYKKDALMPLYIQEVMVACKLKEGHLPSIQTKTFMSLKLHYLKDTGGELQKLTLTSVDLKNLLRDYEIYELHYVQGYKFMSSDLLFKEYVNHYYKLKNESTGALKELYKIFLNSLYGKFAMMTERSQAFPQIDGEKMRFNRTEKEEVDSVYTAAASFITAYARDIILEAAYKNIDAYIYSDTDSLHLTRPAQSIKVDRKELGAWKQEHCACEKLKERQCSCGGKTLVKQAKYLGQKCYILSTDKKEIKKIAGAPAKVKEQITLDNFQINFTSNADLFPKYRMENVDGGVLLIPTTFTISAKN